MGVKKVLKIELERCWDCPNRWVEECEIMGKCIRDLETIPSWCPLEDENSEIGEKQMITKPKPSLCDSCYNAEHVKGGSASMSDGKITYDCPQRYCSEFHIAIHFDGKQECEKYRKDGIK